MKIKNSLILVLLVGVTSFASCFEAFAIEVAPIEQEIRNLFSTPDRNSVTLENGTVVNTLRQPGNNSSMAGTVTAPDGTVTPFTASIGLDGKTTIRSTSNGVTETTIFGADGQFESGFSSPAATEAASSAQTAITQQAGGGPSYVYTTEEMPGYICNCAVPNGGTCDDIKTRIYKCKVGVGLEGFEALFAKIIKYFINVSLLLGVLALAVFGVSLSLLGGDEESTKKSKKYAVNLLIGLTILFLFKYILVFLAPWIFK